MLQDLLTTHSSMPHNPDIANAFFKSGMTEAWGRGIVKIIKSNVGAGKPKPESCEFILRRKHVSRDIRFILVL